MDSRRNFIGTVAGGLAGTLASPGSVLGSNQRARFGVIGLGARGMQLLRDGRASDNSECVAVADIYSTRREQVRSVVPDAKLHADYRGLLDDQSIDAVLIATPLHLHADHFVDALAAGKHVYIERAAAIDLNAAKRMRAAHREAGRLAVQVGHQFCSSGLLVDATRFVNAGWLGRLSAVEATHYRNTPHGKPQWRRPLYPDMTEENIRWDLFLGSAPSREFDAERYLNWRMYWDYSGGGVHENLSQQLAFWYKALDLAIPAEVSARGSIRFSEDGRETPDSMSVFMRHADGLDVNWRSSFGNGHLGTGEYLLGSDGTIYRGQQVRYWPEKVNRPEGLETLGRTRTEPRAHMRNFFRGLRGQAEMNCPVELGYRVSVACAMAIESLACGRPVHWDPKREEIV